MMQIGSGHLRPKPFHDNDSTLLEMFSLRCHKQVRAQVVSGPTVLFIVVKKKMLFLGTMVINRKTFSV